MLQRTVDAVDKDLGAVRPARPPVLTRRTRSCGRTPQPVPTWTHTPDPDWRIDGRADRRGGRGWS